MRRENKAKPDSSTPALEYREDLSNLLIGLSHRAVDKVQPKSRSAPARFRGLAENRVGSALHSFQIDLGGARDVLRSHACLGTHNPPIDLVGLTRCQKVGTPPGSSNKRERTVPVNLGRTRLITHGCHGHWFILSAADC